MAYLPGRRSPARPSAVQEMLADDQAFADRPFSGHAGEVLTAPPVAAAPAAPLVIDPPEWSGREGGVSVVQLPPQSPTDGLAALDVMKLQGGDIEELPPPGPVMVTPPLIGPQLPEPDWRAEEAEQAARDREPSLVELEPPGTDTSYPAKPQVMVRSLFGSGE